MKDSIANITSIEFDSDDPTIMYIETEEGKQYKFTGVRITDMRPGNSVPVSSKEIRISF